MNRIYVNWTELKKVAEENAYIAHAIAAFNQHSAHEWSLVLEGLKKGFPQCFSSAPVTKAIPWSLLRTHCLETWMREQAESTERFNRKYPDLGSKHSPNPSLCAYKMVLSETARNFNLPYIELALLEKTSKNIDLPVIPNTSWQQLKTGEVVNYRGQEYVVIENMGVDAGDGHAEILSLTPIECVDMTA